ncbi:MAG: lipopolysaccharide biosynthesis protein [Bacteroidaceae bacterium]
MDPKGEYVDHDAPLSDSTLKQKTAKGMLWGGVNNSVQLLLNLAFGIFLARILDDKDYGMVGMLTIFNMIAISLQESGFTMALINRPKIIHREYNAVFWFSILMGIGCYAILFFCSPFIADFYHQPQLIGLSRLLFLGLILSSTGTAHNAVLMKKLMVRQRSISQICGLLISGTVGITLALNGMTYWGIAMQSLIYIAVTNGFYWYFSPWKPTFDFNLSPLKSFLPFSIKLLVTKLLTQFNHDIVSVILGRYFTPASVGNFTQAVKWNHMGLGIIDGMVVSVAQPVLKEVDNDDVRQKRVFRKMQRFVAFLSFPALFGLSLVSYEVIVIAITEKWILSAQILQVLAIWGAFAPLMHLYTHLIISRGKSGIFMWSSIAQGVVEIIGMLLLYPFGLMAMVYYFAGINIFWMFVWRYFVGKEIKISLWEALSDLVPFFAIAAGVMITTHFATMGIENIYLRLVSKILMGVLLYMGLVYLVGAQIMRESFSQLKLWILKKK